MEQRVDDANKYLRRINWINWTWKQWRNWWMIYQMLVTRIQKTNNQYVGPKMNLMNRVWHLCLIFSIIDTKTWEHSQPFEQKIHISCGLVRVFKKKKKTNSFVNTEKLNRANFIIEHEFRVATFDANSSNNKLIIVWSSRVKRYCFSYRA